MVDSQVVEEKPEEERNTALSNIPWFKLFGKRIVTTVEFEPRKQTLPTSDTSPEKPLDSSERQQEQPVEVGEEEEEGVTVTVGLVCPRCKSRETKFCYFNNYNVNQPRHFCRGCHRYWTAGGAIRNVPVGAGRRKATTSTASNGSSARSPMKGAGGSDHGGGGFGYSDHGIAMEEVIVQQWLQPSNQTVGFLPAKRANDIGGFHGRIRRPKILTGSLCFLALHEIQLLFPKKVQNPGVDLLAIGHPLQHHNKPSK